MTYMGYIEMWEWLLEIDRSGRSPLDMMTFEHVLFWHDIDAVFEEGKSI